MGIYWRTVNTTAAMILKNNIHKETANRPNQTLNDVRPHPLHAMALSASDACVSGEKLVIILTNTGMPSTGQMIPLRMDWENNLKCLIRYMIAD